MGDRLPVIKWDVIVPRILTRGNYEYTDGWRLRGDRITAPDAVAALRVARKHFGPLADVVEAGTFNPSALV